MSNKKMTPSEVIENRLNTLTGEILTIMEAIIPAVDQDLLYVNHSSGLYKVTSGTTGSIPVRQNTQREAVKDLVKSAFSRAHKDMQDWIK